MKSDWRSSYLQLNPDAALKKLEKPFLARCDGTKRGKDLTDDEEFIKFCIDEEILLEKNAPAITRIKVDTSPLPSLRYLELQLTRRCNLKCLHCYLGPQKNEDLPAQDAVHISRQFEHMGGLRLLISGGEPLLYPALKNYLQQISGLNIRRVLLTNGTLITSENIHWLAVDEIQFSLDGWQDGHEILRGNGSFDKVIHAIHIAQDADIKISIATMVHQGNLNDFDKMKGFIHDIGACEWGIDALCLSGNLQQNTALMVSPQQAAPLMKYAFGGGYHGPSDGFACGRHLMTVLPSGMGVKCGFFEENALGDARKSLKECWLSLNHLPLDKLKCKNCEMLFDCAGGCRFRAKTIYLRIHICAHYMK